jgi:hypothetical protein
VEPNVKAELKLVRTASCTILVAMLTIAATLPAAGQVETIDATARGTSTQMGGTFTVKIIVSQYSTAEDRVTLIDAFKKGSNEGLVKALEKMKSSGRIQVPGRVGYDLAYVASIPTPTGRKIRFVTNRKIAFLEAARSTRSQAYDLTAGEIDVNDQDKNKSAGVLYPAAQLGIDNEGNVSINLRQNPWQLVNVIDWKPKGKE